MGIGTKMTGIVIGTLLALFGGWIIFSSAAETGAFVMGLVVGGMFLLIGLFVFYVVIHGWSTFVAIGSQGINWHERKDRWISWHEIDEVGISVIHSAKGRSVTWIRIAGTVPGLPHRPDLDRWRTDDEPEPYTHKIMPPVPPYPTAEESLVAAALRRYAGPRYTGIDERSTVVHRHS